MQTSGNCQFAPLEKVVFGRPAEAALLEEIERLGKSRVMILTTTSLRKPGGILERISEALGAKMVGTYSTFSAHTPRESVLAAAQAIRTAAPDVLVALGGGSVIDGTKVAQLAVERGIQSVDEFDPWVTGIRSPTEGGGQLQAV